MSDSLLVAGIETLGGTSQSTYKVSTGGLQFGAPEPDQATVASLLLDGDVVTGIRAKNRSITLPITVFATGATSQAIRSALTVACDALLAAVAAQTFTLQWTPDGGLAIIWDCYRARGERQRSIVRDNQGVTMVTLTFPAKPYGRSPVAQTAAVGSTLQIDSFDTAPTGATLDTSIKYEGTGSASVTLTWNGTAYTNATPVSRTYAAKDLSAFGRLTARVLGLAPGAGGVDTTVVVTLGSASGATAYTTTVSAASGWQLAAFVVASGVVVTGTGVNLAAVTSESFTFTTGNNNGFTTRTVHLDDFRASGSTFLLTGPTTHASVLAVSVAVGSARTPVNLALSNGSTFAGFLLHSPPEDQDPSAQILTSLSGASTNQTVTIAATNGILRGTYGVYLGVSTSGGGSVTATVTVQQQQSGSNVGAAKVLTKVYTSGAHVIPVAGLALPLYDVPDDNTTTGYTIQVQITGADRYTEIMLCDTRGQTVYSDTDLATAVANVYADEPSALQSALPPYAGASRSVATSIVGNTWVTGGPVIFEPGNNKLLAWVSTGVPTVTATYYPRWQDERVS